MAELNPALLEEAHIRIYRRFPLSQRPVDPENYSIRNSLRLSAPRPLQVMIRLIILKAGSKPEPLRCELEVAELETYSFEALSYVWGDEGDLRTIRCCGETLQIKPNLFSALEDLRSRDTDRRLWIDAMSIDQKNLKERGEQVSLMGRIYGAALCVLVWLGRPHKGDWDAFDTIALLSEKIPERKRRSSFGSNSPKISRAEIDSYKVLNALRFRHVLEFLSRPWFERVWVIQEVVRAKRAIVICGKKSLPWDDFAKVVLSINEALSYLMEEYKDESLAGTIALDNLPAITSLKKNHEDMTLFAILCIASTFKSTDKRDKLFAPLNLGNPSSLRIQPDYTSNYFDVFRQHVVYELTERHRLDYLARPPVRRHEWPSWIPDWTEPSRSSYFCTAMDRNFYAAADTTPIISIAGDVLSVEGKIIDTVARLVAPMDRSWVQLDAGAETINSDRIIQWLEDCMAFLPLTLSLVRESAESALAPLLRAFICAGDYEKSKRSFWLGRALHDPSAELKHVLEKLAVAKDTALNSGDAQQKLLTPVTDLASKLYPAVADRQFFETTRKKHLGWVSKRARQGDTVCVLYGGAVPFVLRETELGFWKIVGECYVDGLMQGEAMTMGDIPSRTFRIL